MYLFNCCFQLLLNGPLMLIKCDYVNIDDRNDYNWTKVDGILDGLFVWIFLTHKAQSINLIDTQSEIPCRDLTIILLVCWFLCQFGKSKLDLYAKLSSYWRNLLQSNPDLSDNALFHLNFGLCLHLVCLHMAE